MDLILSAVQLASTEEYLKLLFSNKDWCPILITSECFILVSNLSHTFKKSKRKWKSSC